MVPKSQDKHSCDGNVGLDMFVNLINMEDDDLLCFPQHFDSFPNSLLGSPVLPPARELAHSFDDHPPDVTVGNQNSQDFHMPMLDLSSCACPPNFEAFPFNCTESTASWFSEAAETSAPTPVSQAHTAKRTHEDSSPDNAPLERKKFREKQRRMDVNSKFEELHELVTKVECSRGINQKRCSGESNKTEVLSRAIKVIKELWAPAMTGNTAIPPLEKPTNLPQAVLPKPLDENSAIPAMQNWPMLIMPMFLPSPAVPNQSCEKTTDKLKEGAFFPSWLPQGMFLPSEAAKKALASQKEVTTHACCA